MFTILAILVFLGMAVATLIAIIAVLWGIRKRSVRATLIRLGLCILPLAAYILFCTWIFGPADYHSPQDLAAAYRTEFGDPPPSDVTDMRARQVVVGDSGAALLRFRASSQTIDGLLARFVASDRGTFAKAGSGGNVPSWWTPDVDKVESFYTADHWSKFFSYSTAHIGIDREKSIVYFYHSGSD